jgi:hypothetical protein
LGSLPNRAAHSRWDGLRPERPILVRGERAAVRDRGAEQREEVGRDAAGPQLLRRSTSGEVHDTRIEGRDVLYHRRLLPVMLELGG